MSKGSDVHPTNGVTTNITVISLSNQETSRRPNQGYTIWHGQRKQDPMNSFSNEGRKRAQCVHVCVHARTHPDM